MDELFIKYKNYDPDRDIEERGGNYGIYLADLIMQRCGGIENLDLWLLKQRIQSMRGSRNNSFN